MMKKKPARQWGKGRCYSLDEAYFTAIDTQEKAYFFGQMDVFQQQTKNDPTERPSNSPKENL